MTRNAGCAVPSNGIAHRLAAVILRTGGRSPRLLVTMLLVGGSVGLPIAAALDEASGTRPAPAGPASPPEPAPAWDELVYRDGDRLRGRLVERIGGMVIFQANRFGIVQVPADEAEVILATPIPSAPSRMAGRTRTDEPAVERAPFSPWAMTQALKELFGSWHGRLSFGTEVLNDGNDRNSTTLEAHLERKWRRDELKISSRFD
ncbi:MAG TPA: hypothetical protein VGD81_01485, partial [Opitutaceae bacterium]